MLKLEMHVQFQSRLRRLTRPSFLTEEEKKGGGVNVGNAQIVRSAFNS